MADDIPLFPVTGYEIRFIAESGTLLLRLAFASHAFQKLSESDPGRNYALTLKQAVDLRDALDHTIRQLQSAGPQSSPDPKH